MMAVGIGAKSTVTPEDVVSAVRECCARYGIDAQELGGLASLDRAATRVAILAAANELGVRVMFYDKSDLQAQASRCVTHSERSFIATGVPSVAEAAALAAAGLNSALIVPRIAFATVTAALALGAA